MKLPRHKCNKSESDAVLDSSSRWCSDIKGHWFPIQTIEIPLAADVISLIQSQQQNTEHLKLELCFFTDMNTDIFLLKIIEKHFFFLQNNFFSVLNKI